MEIRKNISAPFTGMNRDSNLDRLQDGEFTFALNSDSNGRVRHNEPSNYLYTIFPEGYRVISEPLKGQFKKQDILLVKQIQKHLFLHSGMS